ncbi:tyrosine-type recombinase/integrase [Aquisalinus flavus]|uniref:Recombinase XerC n=1 Tax=Aquisalinus flavus TaxID=1526572 RepID=A0A8J2Y5G8_9PROT|nr:tyrosine-type recombinase/integrase [Aquisalinus flavus]MBD0425802.1 tyrosine-type recombinase/integrase [Aquisalinus flavus]UNE48592.1 tyrosine-type recombinase/integrase [Aquisalinus flavus]GGD13108.1 hypothetical protein GCM10011342_22400 [Aquisalinus flavus]
MPKSSAKSPAKNTRLKREYLTWLEGAKGQDEKTTTQVAAALSLYEKSIGHRDFAPFHFEQARKFKRDLEAARNERTGKPLSQATIRARLNAVKEFFRWLAIQPGYRQKVSYADTEYFSMSRKQERVATATRGRPVPTLDQIRHAIAAAPAANAVERRDRALLAFAILTGMRDAAMASLPLGNVSIEQREVFQDARLVKTKASKTMRTAFFPVGEDLVAIVADWVAYLKSDLLYAETDPLFPQTAVASDGGLFTAAGVKPEYWSDASAIRRIFRERFEAAGLSYFHPHSFRHTLMQEAFRLKLGGEALKAWSQNLGHENLGTSLNSYGKVADFRVGEIMSGLSQPETGAAVEADMPPEALEWMEKLLAARKGR